MSWNRRLWPRTNSAPRWSGAAGVMAALRKGRPARLRWMIPGVGHPHPTREREGRDEPATAGGPVGTVPPSSRDGVGAAPARGTPGIVTIVRPSCSASGESTGVEGRGGIRRRVFDADVGDDCDPGGVRVVWTGRGGVPGRGRDRIGDISRCMALDISDRGVSSDAGAGPAGIRARRPSVGDRDDVGRPGEAMRARPSRAAGASPGRSRAAGPADVAATSREARPGRASRDFLSLFAGVS